MNIGKDMYHKEVQKMRYECFYDVLSEYERQGIKVSIQGVCFPVEKSAEIMSVNEDECYMPDLIMDNSGKVIEVNYDKIVQK